MTLTLVTVIMTTETLTVMTMMVYGDNTTHTDVGRYMVDKERDGPLVSMDLKDFILTVGARSPIPGGGSVAALTASLVSILCHLYEGR